jgi:hypothetical protein
LPQKGEAEYNAERPSLEEYIFLEVKKENFSPNGKKKALHSCSKGNLKWGETKS